MKKNKNPAYVLVIISRIFCLKTGLYLDQHTLDFPVLHLHTGMVQKIDILSVDILSPPGDENPICYKCLGVIFQLGLWFFQFEIIFTPIYFKIKQQN